MIPGLVNPHSNEGYAAALKKVCEAVVTIKLNNAQDPYVKTTFGILRRLAREVWGTRVRQQANVQLGRGHANLFLFGMWRKWTLFHGFQDPVTKKHAGAIDLWRSAHTTLRGKRYRDFCLEQPSKLFFVGCIIRLAIYLCYVYLYWKKIYMLMSFLFCAHHLLGEMNE